MRILTSSKYQAAFVASVIAIIGVCVGMGWLTDNRAEVLIAGIVAVAGAWGVAINGTAKEDAAAKANAPAKLL